MIAENPSVVRNNKKIQKENLMIDLNEIISWKGDDEKQLTNQGKIANDAAVEQYEVSRALREQLAVRNPSFKKLCSYAEKQLSGPFVEIPREIQKAYTRYKSLGGEPDRVAKVIGILASERYSR